MSEKMALITTAREDLFDISRTLVSAFGAAVITDPEKPVIVDVCGSAKAGKMIFPDATRETLLGSPDHCQFRGNREYDEFWCGNNSGNVIEVDFINVAWEYGFSDGTRQLLKKKDYFPEQDDLKEAFLCQRKYGGVSFIHNSKTKIDSSIDIWLEADGKVLVSNEPSAVRARNGSLSSAFERAVEHDASKGVNDRWTRYVELSINDARLLQSDMLCDALSALRKSGDAVAKALESRWPFRKEVQQRPYQLARGGK